jgi:hypothetical protein
VLCAAAPCTVSIQYVTGTFLKRHFLTVSCKSIFPIWLDHNLNGRAQNKWDNQPRLASPDSRQLIHKSFDVILNGIESNAIPLLSVWRHWSNGVRRYDIAVQTCHEPVATSTSLTVLVSIIIISCCFHFLLMPAKSHYLTRDLYFFFSLFFFLFALFVFGDSFIDKKWQTEVNVNGNVSILYYHLCIYEDQSCYDTLHRTWRRIFCAMITSEPMQI